MSAQTFLIIGGVAGGMSAASRIRVLNPEAKIHVFQKNSYVSYIACGMPYLIGGKVNSINTLVMYDAAFFKEKRKIDVSLHHEVQKIIPSEKIITVKNMETGAMTDYPYDRLLISTGARPVVPPLKGINLPGVFKLRELEDGIALNNFVNNNKPQSAVIIGAGAIGMEMAEAFSERNMSVTMVEKMPAILGTMDDEINEVIENELKNRNVMLIKSKAVVEFIGENSVRAVLLEDGTQLKADIVLVSIGIRPNIELARDAGIEIGQTGAIKVNERMETSIPDIYAAGDCAEAYHLLLKRNVYMPLGTTANKQGRVAGDNMAGGNVRFHGIVGTSVFKVFDLEVGRTGLSEKDAKKEGLTYVSNVIEHFSKAHYFEGAAKIRIKLLAEKASGKIIGAQLVGKNGVAKRLDVVAAAIGAGMTAAEMNNLDLSYAPPFAPVYDPILIAANEILKKL